MKRPEKLEDFMYAVMKEARRFSLVEVCYSWGISKDEMYECIDYINEKLEVDI